MGMVGGLGQTGGATGVGSATTQTGNQQLAAPTGGKGGSIPQGMQQPMQRIMQPQQFQQPYRPFGGDVYGYNMNRLARQMDPSATLPQQNFPPTTYTQPGFVDDGYGYGAPQMGGKGGGRMYGYGAPQFFSPFNAPNPFQPQPYYQQPYYQQPQYPVQPIYSPTLPSTVPTPLPIVTGKQIGRAHV